MKKGFRVGSLFQFIDKSMAEWEGFEDAFKIKPFQRIEIQFHTELHTF